MSKQEGIDHNEGEVYLVRVAGRADGLYVFATFRDAKAFKDEVKRLGGSANWWVEPVNGGAGTERLIQVERDAEVHR